MKKFISLLVALVLLVSMFALPMFAFAQDLDDDAGETDNTRWVIGLDDDDLDAFVKAFKKYVIDLNAGLYVEMGSKFQLNHTWTDTEGDDEESEEVIRDWLNDEVAIHELFPNINYLILPEERSSDEIEESEERITITYKAGEHAKVDDEGNAPSDLTNEFYAGKHVTLRSANAFEAEEGCEFVGWLVPVAYDGGAVEVDGDLKFVNVDGNNYYIYRAGDKFVMPETDDGIEVIAYWREKPAEDATDEEKDLSNLYTYPVNDIICLEYCTPSDDPRDENWTRVKVSDTITMETAGWWMFRYVVIDGENGDITDDDAVLTPYNTDEFKAYMSIKNAEEQVVDYNWSAFTLKRYAVDTSNPEIALSSSMTSKMDEGLTVGTSYTVPTSLTITDSSNTTVTYKVYRHSGDGAKTASAEGWELIFDSAAADKFSNDGEKYITSSGVITPVSSDVTSSTTVYRYMIVYTVEDANGYFGVSTSSDGLLNDNSDSEGYHPVLLLGVKLSDAGAKEKARIEAWKIVLFVIAGLSAVGIVVLLVIKPKQAVEGDSRVSAANGADSKSGDATADTSPNKPSDGE